MILPVTHLNRTPIFLQYGNVNKLRAVNGVLLQLWTPQLTVSHNTKHCQYKNPHGMRRSVPF